MVFSRGRKEDVQRRTKEGSEGHSLPKICLLLLEMTQTSTSALSHKPIGYLKSGFTFLI